MNAKELQQENARLKELLARTRNQSQQLRQQSRQSVQRLSQIEQERDQFHRELMESRAQHTAVVEQFEQAVGAKQREIDALLHQIKLLLQRIKGSRQERIDPNQLLLFSLEELKEIAAQMAQGDPAEDLIDDAPRAKRKRRSSGRIGGLPANLERQIIRHELDDQQRKCPECHQPRQEIGAETSEQLELIPAKLIVLEHQRVKYACSHCQQHGVSGQVEIADKPPQPIEKGLPGPGLCAHTVLSKFGDHQPLYRQEDISSRLGLTIRRSTLCGWQAMLADLCLALVLRMKFLVLKSKVIHTDDTSIKMLEPGAGTTLTTKFWTYHGDWEHPYVVFDHTLTRERDGPQRFLAGFEGYLQADAYSGYDCVYAGDRVKEVACWIHARRYWHQAQDNDRVRALTALSYIARLSQIEHQLREAYPPLDLQGQRDFASIATARQTHALPILHEFKAWLDRETADRRILPKSPIRAAFTYTLNQWEALVRYTEAGYLSFDNNLSERQVKVPAIGRKNYLFVGSPAGGRRAAILYSLVSSAKANGVEPFAWLKALFTQLPYHRENRHDGIHTGESFEQAAAHREPMTSTELDYLLPDHWLKAHPQHRWTIDHIRREERKSKSL